MSRKATDWAWNISIKPATLKLILLSLADRADENHCCFPSTQRLVRDTSLDRKTIFNGMGKLIEMGLISDTGERKGATQRVKVFRLAIEKQVTQPSDCNCPENGTIDPGNGTEIGTLNSPKIGTLNGTEIGTQNQSVEPVNEPKGSAVNSDGSSSEENQGSAARQRARAITLNTYIDNQKAKGERTMPDGSPCFKYAEKVGIPPEFLVIAWREFRDRYIDTQKKYRDWPRTFLNCCKERGYGIWYIDNDGNYCLTAKGKQAQKAVKADDNGK